MKVFCKAHGPHFENEFNKTLKKDCDFWEIRKLDKLSKKYKKIVWDWIFALPADEIAESQKIMINCQFYGVPYAGNQYKRDVPGYESWSDKKQRQFQKDYSEFINSLTEDQKANVFMQVYLHHLKSKKKRQLSLDNR